MKLLKEERGISLVEVVASIALLTIVLFSFYTFFIQSAKFNISNNNHYTTNAAARDLSAQITKNCSAVKLKISLTPLCKYDASLKKTGSLEDYSYQLSIQDINDPSIIKTDYYRLRKVTIKVWDQNDDIAKKQPKSITYTYQREVIK